MVPPKNWGGFKKKGEGLTISPLKKKKKKKDKLEGPIYNVADESFWCGRLLIGHTKKDSTVCLQCVMDEWTRRIFGSSSVKECTARLRVIELHIITHLRNGWPTINRNPGIKRLCRS